MTIDNFSKYKFDIQSDTSVSIINILRGSRPKQIIQANVAYVQLTNDNNKQTRNRLADFLATHFIPNPLNLPTVGFLDFDNHNCKLSNLYWTTVDELIARYLEDKELILTKIKNEFSISKYTRLVLLDNPRYAIASTGRIFTTYLYYKETTFTTTLREIAPTPTFKGHNVVNVNGKTVNLKTLLDKTFPSR